MSKPLAPTAITPPIAFGASWSGSTRLLTALFLGCCLAILGFSYSGPNPASVFYATAAVLVIAIVLAYRFAPVGYQVDDSGVTIRRLAGAKHLSLGNLRAARLLEPGELAQVTWRWPAVGGLFGFYGWFETPALGRHRWYAARDEGLVLVQTAQGPVVLSPDEPERFVREVNQRLRAASRIS